MKHLSFIVRAAAASAIAGLTLIGPAVAAGATSVPPLVVSVPVSAPLGVGHVVTDPVVNAGPSPTAPVGADTSVPAHADGNVAIPAPRGRSQHPVAAANASVDACIAASVLTGHRATGCGSPMETRSPSLAGSLSRVGVCARLALAADRDPDTCAAEDSPTAPLGKDAVGNDALGEVVANNGLCTVVEQLGVTRFDACRSATATDGDASGGEGDRDLCLGLAVVSGVDTSRCIVSDKRAHPAPRAAHANHKGADRASRAAAAVPTTATTTTKSTGSGTSDTSCAPSYEHTASTSPIHSSAAAGLGVLGAFTGIAIAVRRLRRPRLV